ncbi:MAG: helix-turn-helix transcriptional regulator [Actinomycetota bacterium]|nr:helix-turn-helix transcriptional regulator [Acidimicrobiia bacterium]MDQ3350497.1 helix-turn-helix transcriptional regulator [Actinomycetota bacterium]
MTGDSAAERGLPRAYLRVVLLTLVAAGPTHGYDLLEQVRAARFRLADAGALYRTLRTMERQQLFESWWEKSSSGPPRRTYTLTESGRAALDAETRELRATVSLLGDVVEQAERVLGAKADAR